MSRRCRATQLAVLLCVLSSAGLDAALGAEDSQAQPTRAVVLIHGFDGGPEDWRGTERVLRAEGFEPLLLQWQPDGAANVTEAAHEVVGPAIEQLLGEAGYGPDQTFHLVTHSLGGLIGRVLLEKPGRSSVLGSRVRSLVMLSTPNQGARTGLARAACHSYHEAHWRPLACDMIAGSPFLMDLGAARPASQSSAYLSIGVEAAALYFPAPPFDGDGDGHRSGHDNAVMAEAAYLSSAPFVIWRGRSQGNHFRVPCSSVVNGWIVDFLRDGQVPVPSRARVPSGNSCKGLGKKAWRRAWDARRAGL